MHIRSSTASNKLVKPGIYEIQSSATSLFLDSVDDPVYNGWCDDALTLKKQPSRRGKWEIAKVGSGYTIKQIATNMFCALADGEQFLYQPVVLSSVPTIWTIEYIEEASEKVRILWSVSDLSWETVRSNEEPVVAMGKPQVTNDDDKPKESFVWSLRPVGGPKVSGKIKPGLYSIQNKVSRTYVMMGPNEKTIGCWPGSDFKAGNTKLWEIAPLGDGYSIRLHGTDKYCTLEEGMERWSSVNVSTFPAAWKIVPNESPLHAGDGYFQVFWGNTNMTWDLSRYGKANPGNPINMQSQSASDYQPCRLFQFIP